MFRCSWAHTIEAFAAVRVAQQYHADELRARALRDVADLRVVQPPGACFEGLHQHVQRHRPAVELVVAGIPPAHQRHSVLRTSRTAHVLALHGVGDGVCVVMALETGCALSRHGNLTLTLTLTLALALTSADPNPNPNPNPLGGARAPPRIAARSRGLLP